MTSGKNRKTNEHALLIKPADQNKNQRSDHAESLPTRHPPQLMCDAQCFGCNKDRLLCNWTLDWTPVKSQEVYGSRPTVGLLIHRSSAVLCRKSVPDVKSTGFMPKSTKPFHTKYPKIQISQCQDWILTWIVFCTQQWYSLICSNGFITTVQLSLSELE